MTIKTLVMGSLSSVLLCGCSFMMSSAPQDYRRFHDIDDLKRKYPDPNLCEMKSDPPMIDAALAATHTLMGVALLAYAGDQDPRSAADESVSGQIQTSLGVTSLVIASVFGAASVSGVSKLNECERFKRHAQRIKFLGILRQDYQSSKDW